MEAISTPSVNPPPAGWRDESVSTDFHELRQDFNPLIRLQTRISNLKSMA